MSLESQSTSNCPDIRALDPDASKPAPVICPSNTSGEIPTASQGTSDSATVNIFSCNRCHRKFNRRENLSRHEKTHSAPWAHRCLTCGKGFARSDLLSRHEGSHQRWAQQGESPSSNISNNISNKRRKQSSCEKDGDTLSNQSPEPSLHSDTQRVRTSSITLTLGSHANSSEHSPHPTENSVQPQPQDVFTYVRTSLNGNPGSEEQGAISPFHEHHSFKNSAHNSQFLTTNNLDLATFEMSRPFMPIDGAGSETMPFNWFSNDFYSAVQETGIDFELGPLDSEIYRPESQDRDFDRQPPFQGTVIDSTNHESNIFGGESGSVSRMASPPNEASDEDRWAFAWDPKSRAILHANPIHIPLENPLWGSHSSKFDISDATYQNVQKFVTSKTEGSRKSTLTLPTLREANVMIGLYFEHFSPQMPVLHHPTIKTNEDLPPPLLSAMLVIGAIYSKLRGSRRFAIVLQDIVRWQIQVAIEYDNNLMRDPKIIFAETLICYAGLWCGNKRAFELAEVTRATMVKQVRSATFWRPNIPPLETGVTSREVRWLQWIQTESDRRLFWVVYTLDSQFPALLYLPAMFSIGEISGMCCPCDIEFWDAPSARHWTSLLGPATIPPARTFSAAAAPFVLSHWYIAVVSGSSSLLTLMLNDWSAFLVLSTLQNQIFKLSQERLFWASCCEEGEGMELDEPPLPDSEMNSLRNANTGPRHHYHIRRQQFRDALTSWHTAYLSTPSKHDSHPTSVHFRESAYMGYVLSLMILDVPITDIQASFGKNGEEGMIAATQNIRHWMASQSRIALDITYTAVETIEHVVTKRTHQPASEQSIIAIFLSYALVWNFVTIASIKNKQTLSLRLAQNADQWKSPQVIFIRTMLDIRSDDRGSCEENSLPRGLSPGILKSAAQCLTQLGTWGAALNIALLLQRRSEM